MIILQFAKTTFRGFTDFAGSAVVHLAGAVLSLPGCVILGARSLDLHPKQPITKSQTLKNSTPSSLTAPTTTIGYLSNFATGSLKFPFFSRTSKQSLLQPDVARCKASVAK